MKFTKESKQTLIVLAACLLIFLGFFAFCQLNKEEPQANGSTYTAYEMAEVLSIITSDITNEEVFENSDVGTQQLLIRINSGDFKGLTYNAINYVGALYGSTMKEGNRIIVSLYVSDNEVTSAVVYEYDRGLWVCLIIGIFMLVTILVGGKRGLRSLLALVFTIICILFLLIPLLMMGAPTILTSFLLCLYVAIVSFVLIGGVSKKTTVAMISTGISLAVSVLFGLLAQNLVRVNGMRMGDYVDALLQLKQGGTPLQIKGLLIGGTIIASLGAIMDVAMSIASASSELIKVQPELTAKDLWKSGMNIGRDMIGTMTNTLILAFVGSSLLLVIYIYSLNVPVYELLSSTLVATEIVHSITSSIAVIFSVPITVFISCLLLVKKK